MPSLLQPPQASLDGGGYCSPRTPGASDVESAYANALRMGSDIHLLRLLQKTGPCWNALSSATAGGLLAVLVRMVRGGSMLPRVSD